MKKSDVWKLIMETKKIAEEEAKKRKSPAKKKDTKENINKEGQKKVEEKSSNEGETETLNQEEMTSALVELLEIIKSYVASLVSLRNEFEADKSLLIEKLIYKKLLPYKNEVDKKFTGLYERMNRMEALLKAKSENAPTP